MKEKTKRYLQFLLVEDRDSSHLNIGLNLLLPSDTYIQFWDLMEFSSNSFYTTIESVPNLSQVLPKDKREANCIKTLLNRRTEWGNLVV